MKGGNGGERGLLAEITHNYRDFWQCRVIPLTPFAPLPPFICSRDEFLEDALRISFRHHLKTPAVKTLALGTRASRPHICRFFHHCGRGRPRSQCVNLLFRGCQNRRAQKNSSRRRMNGGNGGGAVCRRNYAAQPKISAVMRNSGEPTALASITAFH
jgi:hypothetical protein